MKVLQNIKLLEGTTTKKKHHGAFSLKFDAHKKHHALRKDHKTTEEEEEAWQLSRFHPMLEELIEKLGKNDLPKEEFQCMNGPRPQNDSSNDTSAKSDTETSNHPHSRRSRRTAKPHPPGDGHSSHSTSTHTAPDFRNMGKRIFVFIIGGATRSELRVCHKLTAKLKREVILGSTSLDDPSQYIAKVKMFSE